jgi:UDP-N-acetylglucosamine--dolichyl-phosphate N-acetylglucosaminephosphotransferase
VRIVRALLDSNTECNLLSLSYRLRRPEALGIVPGAVFLICLIFCLVGYTANFEAANSSKLLEINAALLSVCFMLFLGFSDDVLDWPWRVKLILPTAASLPLLCCYNGSTTIVVPIQLRRLLWAPMSGTATLLGDVLGYLITIDANAEGSLVDLGYFYLLYMGMLAVFCTNAINIFAGINGLEAGQSYVIACAILVHNLVEIASGRLVDNHMFSVMTMLSFTGVTLGLLQHNWYPAKVFVGDTFCYFAGMTFAVVGILGHFSKTLLLFFIPQVINFLWSTPQLFKFVPCPRHRLPFFNSVTGLMEPSTFPCKPHEFKWLKRRADDVAVPNMTVINLCLQILGPMNERSLCLCLLAFQVLCCTIGFFSRYYLATFFFE